MTDAHKAAAPLRAPAPLLLTVADACSALRLSRAKLYDLMRQGDLTALKIGRATRFRAADIAAFAERGTGGRVA